MGNIGATFSQGRRLHGLTKLSVVLMHDFDIFKKKKHHELVEYSFQLLLTL